MAHVCLLQVRVEKDKVIIRANKQVTGKRMWRMYAGKLTDKLINLRPSKKSQPQQLPGSSVTEKVKTNGSMLSRH